MNPHHLRLTLGDKDNCTLLPVVVVTNLLLVRTESENKSIDIMWADPPVRLEFIFQLTLVAVLEQIHQLQKTNVFTSCSLRLELKSESYRDNIK